MRPTKSLLSVLTSVSLLTLFNVVCLWEDNACQVYVLLPTFYECFSQDRLNGLHHGYGVKVELQGLINGLNRWPRGGRRRYSNISCSVSCFITVMSSCADMGCRRRKYIKMEK